MVTIKENISLRGLNTFGLDVQARYFVEVQRLEDVTRLRSSPAFTQQPRLVLGGGSNILFTRDFPGLVIRNVIPGKRVVEENGDNVLVEVGAGENWHAFVTHCINQNWGGVENLSLIPGCAGAAPIQNIGAYGVEVKHVVEWVDGIDLEQGEVRRITRDECRFGYRDSVFKHALREKFLISSVTLRLTKKNHRLDTHYGAIREVLERKKITSPTIRDVSNAVIAIRQSKLPDPAVIGNAGSFFKNPTIPESQASSLQKSFPKMPSYPAENQNFKIPAGWLIEQCGWKGKTFGRVGVHADQALVLVNAGGGTGAEILSLAEKILASVKEKFGIVLMTEVNIV